MIKMLLPVVCLISGCAVAAPPEDAPEQAYRKIQETVERAKNVSVKFRCEFALGVLQIAPADGKKIGLMTATYAGTLLLKNNELRIELLEARRGLERKDLIVSDGDSIQCLSETKTMKAPQDMQSAVAEMLMTSGIARRWNRMLYGRRELSKDLQSELFASDFESLPPEGGKSGITYKVNDRQTGKPVYVAKLYFDPRSHLVSSSSFQGDMTKAGSARILETYQDWDLRTEIPNETFRWQ